MTSVLTSLFFLGLFYRSASLYHPQRRAILHLKDMSKRKGKDKNKAENKPPYFDLSSLGSPQFRVVLFAAAMATLGAYAPLFYLVSLFQLQFAYNKSLTVLSLPLLQIPLALEEGLGESMAIQLQTFLGVSMSLGSVFFGLIVLSKSKQCMISRRYLVQASMFGIGETPDVVHSQSHRPPCPSTSRHGACTCSW